MRLPTKNKITTKCKVCGTKLYSVSSFLGIEPIRIGNDQVICSKCQAEYKHIYRKEYVDTSKIERILYRLGFWCMPKIGFMDAVIGDSYGDKIWRIIFRFLLYSPVIIMVYVFEWLFVMILQLFLILNLVLVFYQNKEIKESIKRKPRRTSRYTKEYEDSLPDCNRFSHFLTTSTINRVKLENEENRMFENRTSVLKDPQEKIGLYQRLKKYIHPKILYVLTTFFVFVLASLSLFGLNQLRYTSVVITSDNYEDYMNVSPIIKLTKYFKEEDNLPDKYIYHLDLNQNEKYDFAGSPVFYVQYHIQGLEETQYSYSFDFETELEIYDVILVIAKDYQEEVRVLKSVKSQIVHTEESIQEYSLSVELETYYYKELSVTQYNYSHYMSLSINDPISIYFDNAYDYTEYSIDIDLYNNVEEVLFLQIAIGYSFSNIATQSTFHLNDIVNFTYENTDQIDSYGNYDYYDYLVQTIHGRIVVRLPNS